MVLRFTRSLDEVALMPTFAIDLMRRGRVLRNDGDDVIVEVKVPQWAFEMICMFGIEYDDSEDATREERPEDDILKDWL